MTGLATLVAFVHCLEATAQDDALELLEALLRELFGNAIKADRKARLRTLKDLDQGGDPGPRVSNAGIPACPIQDRAPLPASVA